MLRFSGKTAAATLLAAATALTLTACSSSTSHPAAAPTGTSTSSSPGMSPSMSSSTSASTSPGTGTGSTGVPVGAPQIVISNFTFSPSTLSVSAGQKVAVINNDSVAHTVTASTGNAFDTGNVNPGQTVTFTAPATAGTYAYTCTIHPFMHGTLTVK